MSRAVQREETPGEFLATGTDGVGTSALRQVAAERLAAHRNRRAQVDAAERARSPQVGSAIATDMQPAAERVRDAVAARYRESQSYREFLAVEAQRALERAQAEAEVAARNAVAVAAAQRQLLEEIAQWNEPAGPGPLAMVEPRV
jgi:membrane carboxypeptidase/penicillin-binding protein